MSLVYRLHSSGCPRHGLTNTPLISWLLTSKKKNFSISKAVTTSWNLSSSVFSLTNAHTEKMQRSFRFKDVYKRQGFNNITFYKQNCIKLMFVAGVLNPTACGTLTHQKYKYDFLKSIHSRTAFGLLQRGVRLTKIRCV